MKRRTGIALATAALIGATGGVVFAVNGAGSPSAGPSMNSSGSASAAPRESPSTISSPSPSSTPFGSGTAEDNIPLLYVADEEIHDGDLVIDVGEQNSLDNNTVLGVDRLSNGYLVATDNSSGKSDQDLYTVDSGGSSRRLTSVFSNYDINLTKDRVVAIDFETKRAIVYSSNAKVVGETGEAIDNARKASVGFVGDDVLILTTDSKGKQKAVRWNPETSKTKKVDAPELTSANVSPGGAYVAGNVTGTEEEKSCLGVRSDERTADKKEWDVCGWRIFGGGFSPDGTKVLAVPERSDGFGPGELAVFGVNEGPDEPLVDFKTPAQTSAAIWADNEHLWLVGARGGSYDFEKGAWIKKCDFEGRCEDVVKTKKGYAVLGGDSY